MDVGKRIVELRKERDMSQYALWKKAEISQGSLSQYEAGKKTPGIDVIEKICKGLGVTLAEFFDAEIETPPSEKAARALIAEAKKLGAIRDDGTVDEDVLNRIVRFLRSGSELIEKRSDDGQ